MNIVFFAHFAGSPHHGMVLGHYFLAREWIRMGHQVTIISASFAHTRFTQPRVFGNQIIEENIDGIQYIWVPCPAYDASARLGRIRNILSFVFKAWTYRFPIEKVDIVIASSHYPFAIFPARKIAKAHQATLVFEVRDLWPLTLIELGNVKKSHPFIRIMQWAEDYAYRQADSVVSVLPYAKKYMMQHGMREDKFLYVPNGVFTECIQGNEVLPASYLKKIEERRSSGAFLIGYAGRMGEANCLEELIDAVNLISQQNINVFFLGDGYCKNKLQQKCNEMGIADLVFFLPPVAKKQVAAFLERMDVLYIGLQKKPIFRYGVSPTKLNDYLLAAKPIVYAIDADNEAIEESEAGLFCRSGKSQEIKETINTLYDMTPEQRMEMGAKGRIWVRHERDYRILAKRFLEGISA